MSFHVYYCIDLRAIAEKAACAKMSREFHVSTLDCALLRIGIVVRSTVVVGTPGCALLRIGIVVRSTVVVGTPGAL